LGCRADVADVLDLAAHGGDDFSPGLAQLQAKVDALAERLSASRRRLVVVTGHTDEDFEREIAKIDPPCEPTDMVSCVGWFAEPDTAN
jgi:hypothetical protein